MSKRPAWLLLAAALLAGSACSRPVDDGAAAPGAPAATADADLEGPDLFAEVAAAAGVKAAYRNGEEGSPHLSILESLGGGIALIDYDGDGLLDIFIPGGGYFDGPDRKQIKGLPCKLYRNLGNFQFRDVTKEVGLADVSWWYTHGAAVADYDRDGWPDLPVTG